MAIKLNPEPSRMFTLRECTKILGSLIGGLMMMANPEDVKDALIWWLENWTKSFGSFEGATIQFGENLIRTCPECKQGVMLPVVEGKTVCGTCGYSETVTSDK